MNVPVDIDPYEAMTKTRQYIFLPMERDIIVSHDVPSIDNNNTTLFIIFLRLDIKDSNKKTTKYIAQFKKSIRYRLLLFYGCEGGGGLRYTKVYTGLRWRFLIYNGQRLVPRMHATTAS